jgi:predicted RNase H-like HicB family nuclease
MKYAVNLETGEEGGYTASCSELGLTAHGLSPSNALDSLRDEIRYRLEMCPCTSVDDDYVQVDVSA